MSVHGAGPNGGCLRCRQALAAKPGKGAPAPQPDEGPRTILKMTQKFSRNPGLPARQDLAKCVFDIANGEIRYRATVTLLNFGCASLGLTEVWTGSQTSFQGSACKRGHAQNPLADICTFSRHVLFQQPCCLAM